MSKHITDKIKAVFFDLDDTLVGTIDAKWEQHKYIAKKYYNKILTDDEIRLHWGKPLQEMITLLYGTKDAEDALAKHLAHHESFPKVLYEATLPTLRHLKAEGKVIGIVTATSRYNFEYDTKLHKITKDLIDYSQTSDDTVYHKPDPKVFEPATAWLKGKHIKPEEVIYIGDGLHDMKAALGAGFNFLGVETGLVTAEQFKDAGAISIPNVGHLLG